MRLVGNPDGTVNDGDRAIWLTLPFDWPFRIPPSTELDFIIGMSAGLHGIGMVPISKMVRCAESHAG